jgi:BirA family biotin operon repressor/biotin-[acetyl-CoA-carboxylase] ligase
MMDTPDPAWSDRHPIVRLGVVDSTQTVAFTLAEGGATDGTVVVATSQRAGRGRRGRVWLDEPGASLLFSILVRPRLAPTQWPLLSLMAAVAVARALGRVAGLSARLKWPNDVLVGGRKVAGIILESRLTGQGVVIIGVGINLAQERFPPDLEGRATSVRQASGQLIEPERLLRAVLDEIDTWRTKLEGEGFRAIGDAWKALSSTLGAWVRVDEVSGRAIDLEEDGALVIDDGRTRHRVRAGELMEESADAARH